MDMQLKRKLRVAAILLGMCLAFAGLAVLGGCTVQVYKFDVDATGGPPNGAEALVNSDEPNTVQARGTVAILFNRSSNPEPGPLLTGNPLEPAEPETPEPSEQQQTSDE